VSQPGDRGSWGWFALWCVVGVGLSLGVLGAFTIGIFVLPVAIAGGVLIATRRCRAGEPFGLAAGLGLLAIYVGYLNRRGPGVVCSTSTGGSKCTEEWSPWPWLVGGLVLLIGGIGMFGMTRTTGGRHTSK
jgi:hypothetical protein